MSLARRFRSTSFRLAAAFAGLFVLVAVIVFPILYWQVSSELEKHVKQRVEATRDRLKAVAEKQGLEALKTWIENQPPAGGDPETIFLFTNADGAFVAGNVRPIPRTSGWAILYGSEIEHIGEKIDDEDGFYILWTPVAGGHLLVGHSDQDVDEAEEGLLRGLAMSLALTLLLAVAGGLWLGARAEKRITAINATLGAVAEGRLDHRIPLSRSGDDLDQVGQRINQTLDRLQALIESMRQVSADIAHELKTPLGRLRQRLDVARRSAETVEAYQEAIDGTVGEVNALVETFEALLKIAQLEAGARKARFTQVDLKDVLANVAEAYGAVAEDAGHTFERRLDMAGPAHIRGDRELLTQLFANLLENAIRHCPRGSHITMALQPGSPGPLVEIADTGPGIPLDEREKVFRRLYRLEKSRTTPGSGLGLSVVAAIVELHDAKIELADNGPGLAVSILFPGGIFRS
ncbi:MAG: sensor histidine kinase [Methyloligellaceae bacterium]